MQLLKRWFDFYVFSNVHVALATFCLTKVTLLFFSIHFNQLPLFVFFATLLSYNFIRLYRKSEIKSWLNQWIHSNQQYLIVLSLISLGTLLYLSYQLRVTTLMALTPLGLLTIFYILPIKDGRSLRTLPGVKLFLIAFCWAIVTVLLPVVNYEIKLSNDVMIIFIQRIFFVAAITIPFDIRDVEYDSESLRTLPKNLGIAKAKRLGILFLMIFLGLNFLKEASSQMLRIEFVITLLSLVLLVRATPKQNKYYSAFYVEAIPIIWLLLIII